MNEYYNLFLFALICICIYGVFLWLKSGREGMENQGGESTTSPTAVPTVNGIAGNAASYKAKLKSYVIKLQDTFLLNKYHAEYEDTILTLDEYFDNLMLKTALSVDVQSPAQSIKALAELQMAKSALNSIVKFVDNQS